MAMNAREFMQTDVVLLAIILYALLGKAADLSGRAARAMAAELASGVPSSRERARMSRLDATIRCQSGRPRRPRMGHIVEPLAERRLEFDRRVQIVRRDDRCCASSICSVSAGAVRGPCRSQRLRQEHAVAADRRPGTAHERPPARQRPFRFRISIGRPA